MLCAHRMAGMCPYSGLPSPQRPREREAADCDCLHTGENVGGTTSASSVTGTISTWRHVRIPHCRAAPAPPRPRIHMAWRAYGAVLMAVVVALACCPAVIAAGSTCVDTRDGFALATMSNCEDMVDVDGKLTLAGNSCRMGHWPYDHLRKVVAIDFIHATGAATSTIYVMGHVKLNVERIDVDTSSTLVFEGTGLGGLRQGAGVSGCSAGAGGRSCAGGGGLASAPYNHLSNFRGELAFNDEFVPGAGGCELADPSTTWSTSFHSGGAALQIVAEVAVAIEISSALRVYMNGCTPTYTSAAPTTPTGGGGGGAISIVTPVITGDYELYATGGDGRLTSSGSGAGGLVVVEAEAGTAPGVVDASPGEPGTPYVACVCEK